MITLPQSIRNRAIFRILWMPEGQWTAAGGQPWQVLPVPAIFDRTSSTPGTVMTGTVAQGGYHVERVTRWCLPDEDRASFYIDTGQINGVLVDALDLTGYTSQSPGVAIKIQVMDDETFPNGVSSLPTGPGSGWKTVFVGTVIYQRAQQFPGITGAGRTIYYCAGVLSRTRNWPLDRHYTAAAPHAKGHPGYNIPLHGWFRKALGNKDPNYTPSQPGATPGDPFGDMSGANGYPDIHAYYQAHKLPVDGTTSSAPWTDLEVVKHALASSRALGEPLIQVNVPSDLFGGTYAWSVSPGDSCFDLLRRVCNRQRGRGSCFMVYDDGSNPDGSVGMTLSCIPSFPDSLIYSSVQTYGDMPLLGTNTIQGAQRGSTAIDVDLNGDHRITDDGFQYDDRTSSVVDMLVVQGEPIQVLCNLNFFGGSLEKRWSATDQATFSGLGMVPFLLCLPRWRQIWRRYGIPAISAWNFSVQTIPYGPTHTIDYDTDNSGGINTSGLAGSTFGLSSVMTVRVLPDLPIYEGWNYSAQPDPVKGYPRWDAASDYLPPGRMPPVVMYQGSQNAGASPAWLPLNFAGFNIQVDDFGLYISHPIEDSTGYRFLSNPTDDPNHFQPMENQINTATVSGINTSSGFNKLMLNTIVGLELGTRPAIRYNSSGMSGNYDQLGRRMVITIDGLHLWLSAPNAIFELDYTAAAQLNYAPGLPVWCASPGTPGVLRDDRNALAFISSLAWYYYGTIHNPGTWTIKDCGFLTEFATDNAGSVKYPTLGQFVATVTYNGTSGNESIVQLNTPITCIDYVHDSGETTWRTDFVAYDGNLQ
ncbi:MAG: hypothetical protein KGN77_05155 [Xanthomonadaceae bacterium]|nr:hypothetical protein [Xanthomonadaceae bacterium]